MITNEEARKIAAEWADEGDQLAAVAEGREWHRAPLTAQVVTILAREWPWTDSPERERLLGFCRWSIYGAPGSPGYGRRVLRSYLTESSGDGDVWGWGMSVGGGLCDVLWHIGASDEIPDEMGYSPGIGGPDVKSYPAETILEGFESGDYGTEDMTYYCRVLSRYLDLCKRAGRDY